MKAFRRNLRGAWSTSPDTANKASFKEDAAVMINPATPHAVYTVAGCQHGYMHYTLAAQMAVAMLEAAAHAAEADSSSIPAPILILTDRRKVRHARVNVLAIRSESAGLTLEYKDGETELLRPAYTLSIEMGSFTASLREGLAKIADIIPSLSLFGKGGEEDSETT